MRSVSYIKRKNLVSLRSIYRRLFQRVIYPLDCARLQLEFILNNVPRNLKPIGVDITHAGAEENHAALQNRRGKDRAAETFLPDAATVRDAQFGDEAIAAAHVKVCVTIRDDVGWRPAEFFVPAHATITVVECYDFAFGKAEIAGVAATDGGGDGGKFVLPLELVAVVTRVECTDKPCRGAED